MTTVGMNYKVRQGKQEAFGKKFALVQKALRGTPGHVATELFRSVNNEGSFLVLSEWQSRGSFEAFVRSDVFRSVTAWGEANILEARPKHTVYGDDNPVAGSAGCQHQAGVEPARAVA